LAENVEAKNILDDALNEFTALLAHHPNVSDYRWGQAASKAVLTQVLRDLGDNEHAVTVANEAIAEYSALLKDDPDVPGHKHDRAVCRSNLGQVLHKLDRNAEAEHGLREAIRELRELAEASAHVPQYRDGLAWSWTRLGELFWATDRFQQAREAFQRARELRNDLAERFTQQAGYKHQLAWLLATCPDPDFRDAREAVRRANQAIEIAPRNETYRNCLGVALYRAEQWKASIQALEEAMELRTAGTSLDWFFLAMAHWKLGDTDLALEEYRKAKQWMEQHKPDDPELLRFRDEAMLLGITMDETAR
ncbi:MAG: tetratricopeptide repeat protein, partial [Planctomycetes bacterium]|nr:tetratricopeptide repeat protein [Planctomycetota bacterium]